MVRINTNRTAKARHQQGPNKEEQKLFEELKQAGIKFEHDVALNNGMGVPDVVVGKIIGELDGLGHWANWKSKKGVSRIANVMQKLIVDARHDKIRIENGYTVIRDSNPSRLAWRIAKVLKGEAFNSPETMEGVEHGGKCGSKVYVG